VEANLAHEPGRFISRDVTKIEKIETELNNLIERLHNQRLLNEGERQTEEAWRESERREEARRREENRGGWLSWYRCLEHGYLERAAECARRADRLASLEIEDAKGDAV